MGQQFRDDLGFIPRLGVDILTASVMRRLRPEWSSKPCASGADAAVQPLSPRRHRRRRRQLIAPSLTAEFHDASTAVADPHARRGIPAGAVPAAGHAARIPDRGGALPSSTMGDLTYTGAQLETRRARRRAVRGGGYYDGDRVGATGGGRVRFNSHLATTLYVEPGRRSTRRWHLVPHVAGVAARGRRVLDAHVPERVRPVQQHDEAGVLERPLRLHPPPAQQPVRRATTTRAAWKGWPCRRSGRSR